MDATDKILARMRKTIVVASAPISETTDKNMVVISAVKHVNTDHQSLKPRIRT